jgi:hypothetical protein
VADFLLRKETETTKSHVQHPRDTTLSIHTEVSEYQPFWDIALFSLVETDRRFRGACRLHHQDCDQLLPDYTVQYHQKL